MYIREESGAFAKVDERKEKKHTPTHTRTHTYTRTMRARNLVGVSYYSFESILNGQAFGQPRTRTGRGWRSIAIFLLATLVSAAQFPTPYLYPLMVRSPCVCVDVICVCLRVRPCPTPLAKIPHIVITFPEHLSFHYGGGTDSIRIHDNESPLPASASVFFKRAPLRRSPGLVCPCRILSASCGPRSWTT